MPAERRIIDGHVYSRVGDFVAIESEIVHFYAKADVTWPAPYGNVIGLGGTLPTPILKDVRMCTYDDIRVTSKKGPVWEPLDLKNKISIVSDSANFTNYIHLRLQEEAVLNRPKGIPLENGNGIRLRKRNEPLVGSSKIYIEISSDCFEIEMSFPHPMPKKRTHFADFVNGAFKNSRLILVVKDLEIWKDRLREKRQESQGIPSRSATTGAASVAKFPSSHRYGK